MMILMSTLHCIFCREVSKISKDEPADGRGRGGWGGVGWGGGNYNKTCATKKKKKKKLQ